MDMIVFLVWYIYVFCVPVRLKCYYFLSCITMEVFVIEVH